MMMSTTMTKKHLLFIGLACVSSTSSAFQVNPIHTVGRISHHAQQLSTSQFHRNVDNVPFYYHNEVIAATQTRTSTTQGVVVKNSLNNDDMITEEDGEAIFNSMSTISLVGAQSLLVAVAVIAANFLGVANYGLGEGFQINAESIQSGALATLPLFALAFILDFVEKKVPALQDVTKATQRSVLALLGGIRRPLIGIGVSIALGTAAGLGEEMLFRGVLQSQLGEKFGDVAALTSSAVIFGALHAVTPLYALLAGLASLYFGELYLQYHNLAVPIICHGLYDVGALFAAHVQVTSMTSQERIDLENWVPPGAQQS